MARWGWIISRIIKEKPWRLSHAGHTIRGKYRTYGEGSVHHNGHPCEHGLNLDSHPIIIRVDYDSYWHFLRSELAAWCLTMDFRTRDLGPFFASGAKPLPPTFWTRLAKKLSNDPWGIRSPRIQAGLWPKDSIYEKKDHA